MASRSFGLSVSRLSLVASRARRTSMTSPGSRPLGRSGTSPGVTRAWRRHSICASCQATSMVQFTQPSMVSKRLSRWRARSAAVCRASSMVAGGARRPCSTRRALASTSGHAFSQVRDEFGSAPRNSVTEGPLDLGIGDGERPSLGSRGPAGFVARAPEPCRAGLPGSGQPAGHTPTQLAPRWIPSVVEVVPIRGCVQSRGRGGPR